MVDLKDVAQRWLEDNLIVNDEGNPNEMAQSWIFQLTRLLEGTDAAARIEGRVAGLREAAGAIEELASETRNHIRALLEGGAE